MNKAKKTLTREQRNEILKANGINTDNFFDLSIRVPFGAKVEIKVDGKEYSFNPLMENYDIDNEKDVQRAIGDFCGLMNQVAAEKTYDPVVEKIIEDGYVNSTKLFRRWIAAHTFRMLNYQSYRNPNRKGWEACMKDCFDYNYQFKMMLEEIRVLSILQREDPELFEERIHFFNGDVVVKTLCDYRDRLMKYVTKSRKKRTKKYRNKEYVRLAKYGDVFVSDLFKVVYDPINIKIGEIKKYAEKNDYKMLYVSLNEFMKEYYNKLPRETTKCQVWKDAYKAAGAFYTLQNTIRHTGMILAGCSNKYDSERKLYELLAKYKGEEWRLHKVLVDAIDYNNFNLKERIEAYKK